MPRTPLSSSTRSARRDLHPLRAGDETVIDLKFLTSWHGAQVPHELARGPGRRLHPHGQRLRGRRTGIFPALERTLDLTNIGPLTLLTGYQTPAAIRRIGAKRAANLAAQPSCCPLRPARRDRRPRRRTAPHQSARRGAGRAAAPHAGEGGDGPRRTSMPGLGVILGAAFLAVTGGDMPVFGTADRPRRLRRRRPGARDSGKISGNLRRARSRGRNRGEPTARSCAHDR
jgi:hypothetical protein